MTLDIDNALDSLPTVVSLIFADSEPAHEVELNEHGDVVLAVDMPLPKRVVVVLRFSENGFGFGEIAIVQTRDGVFVDTECMSIERVQRYVNELLDKAITDNDQDPTKHNLYSKTMGRSCGPACPVCGSTL